MHDDLTIEALLSPYRGFRPPAEALLAELQPLRRRRNSSVLPSPESWDMFEFVQALTA